MIQNFGSASTNIYGNNARNGSFTFQHGGARMDDHP